MGQYKQKHMAATVKGEGETLESRIGMPLIRDLWIQEKLNPPRYLLMTICMVCTLSGDYFQDLSNSSYGYVFKE